MAVNQHMVGSEIPPIESQYHESNNHNGHSINIETDCNLLDYHRIDSKFVCNLSYELYPNPNPAYNPFRVFVVDNCSSFEAGLNYITSKQFVKFFHSLPYGFVIVLKCKESTAKHENNIFIKLNSNFKTSKPVIVSFEADNFNKVFYKNYGENLNFTKAMTGQLSLPVTDFGSLLLNLENIKFGYFPGIFEDITLDKCGKSGQNTIVELMDIFARKKDLLGIRFLHLFNPQLRPDRNLMKIILEMDYINTNDNDFDGFLAIFDYNIRDRSKSSTASQLLSGFDCQLITNITFKNDDNLLMLAVKKQNFEAVEFFISCGINVNLSNSECKMPADIAFEFGLYDILLLLLHANSMYPRLFYKTLNMPKEMTILVDLSTKLHELIKNIHERYENGIIEVTKDDLESVDNIISQYPHLDYWYSMSNESAATKAICLKKFGLYNFLLRSGLFVGPYEDITTIKKNLSEDEQHKIRVINAESAQPIPKDYLLVLRLNSYTWQNKKFQKANSNLIEAAFNTLDMIPELQPILEIVAAAKTFRIIFDFNNCHVETLDFTSSKTTSAVFHLRQSHIYIGAKDLLDNTKKYSTIATLGHELTHFAMLLTYENLCNPYCKDDINRKNIFQAVHHKCMKEQDNENLIYLVYKYDLSRQHAELIVRAPHMIIHYMTDEKRFKTLELLFHSLFDYYKTYVLEDVRDKIKNVNKQFCENIKFEHEFWEKKRKKQKVVKYSLISTLFLALIGFFLILLNSFEPCLNFDNMSCKWDELKESTKERLLSKKVEFNGNFVELRKLSRKYPEILTFLTDADIKNIEGIVINPQDVTLPFKYYARKVTGYDEDYYFFGGNCSYKYFPGNTYDLKTYESKLKSRKIYHISDEPVAGKSTLFIERTRQKRSETSDIWVDYLDLEKFNFIHYTSLTNWTSTNLTNFLIDVHNAGREDLQKIKLKTFECEMFKKNLASGDVTLFIDHIDNIFMDNDKFAESFLNALFKMSNNKSEFWIASQNWFGERIEKIIENYDKDYGGRHKLLPLHCEDRNKFLIKTYNERHLTSNEVDLVRNRINEVFKLTDKWRVWKYNAVDNICLLKIMINHTIKSVRKNETNVNFYDILRDYMDEMKAHKKGPEAYSEAADPTLISVALRYVELHYSSSLKAVNLTKLIDDQIHSINYDTNGNFTVYGQNGSSWDLTNSKILHELERGVLKVDINQNISFLHLINFEYYLANYIRNKMWHRDFWRPQDPIFDEKLLLLFNIFKDLNTEFPIVQRCIVDAVKVIQRNEAYKRNYDEMFKVKFTRLYDDFINGTNVPVGLDLTKVFDDDEEMKEIIRKSGIIQQENYKRYNQAIKNTKTALD